MPGLFVVLKWCVYLFIVMFLASHASDLKVGMEALGRKLQESDEDFVNSLEACRNAERIEGRPRACERALEEVGRSCPSQEILRVCETSRGGHCPLPSITEACLAEYSRAKERCADGTLEVDTSDCDFKIRGRRACALSAAVLLFVVMPARALWKGVAEHLRPRTFPCGVWRRTAHAKGN